MVVRAGARILAGLAYLLALSANALACSLGAPSNSQNEEEYQLRVTQRSMAPHMRGVAYDVPGERVFMSVCRRREYDCDLLVVSLGGVRNAEAPYFRQHGEYGYTWPTISIDGRHLAAVRTPRRQRPSQRNVTQELVDIDLRTGEERVMASAGEGRFDRVVYAGDQTLIVVRSFRSRLSLRCVGEFCTDWAEVLLIHDGETDVLPIETISVKLGTGRSVIDIVPLGDRGPFFIEAAGRQVFRDGYVTTRRGSAWILDVETRTLSPAVRSQPEILSLLTQVEQQYGSLGGWSREDIFPSRPRAMRVGPTEVTPFCSTRAELAGFHQTTLAGSRQGAYVVKLRGEGQVIFHVVAVENRGSIPWSPRSQTMATYSSQ